MWKEVNGERTYFFYSDEGLIAKYDEQGKEIRSYGWQPDSTWGTNPLWLKENGVYYWYRNDHLGTPQTLVDSSGTVVWQAQYTAFGKASIEIDTIENNLRFPGQYYDGETGLHYNFHRYYDPATRRYTQPDPLGFNGGINLYAYVGNNPDNAIDPFGFTAIVSNVPSHPNASNCLGGAMTGKTDQYRYPDSGINKKDSFKDALQKEGWSCVAVTSYKECNCECKQEKLLITLWLRSSPQDPWNDPDFPYGTYHQEKSEPENDIHAIRGFSGCSTSYDEIPYYFPNIGERNLVTQKTLDVLFGGKLPLLCCCKGESPGEK